MNNQQQLCLMCFGKSIKGRNFASVKNSRWRYPVDSISFVYMSNLIFPVLKSVLIRNLNVGIGTVEFVNLKVTGGSTWTSHTVKAVSPISAASIRVSRHVRVILFCCTAHRKLMLLQWNCKSSLSRGRYYLNLCEVEIFQKI